MPHERIPLTLIERREACAETATNPPVHRSLPRRSRWAVASADFIEGLRGVRKGDPLRLLAEVFAVAADAELACVIGPHVVDPGGDAIAEDAFVVHAAHGRSTRPLDGLAFPAAGSVCGRAFATGRPFLVGRGDREAPRPESVLPEPVLRESVLRESVLLGGSALVVPVTGAGDPGRPALTLTACRPPAALPFTPADLESAADFARLASAGLHLDQSGTDRARLAVLSDRDRIARELHDRVIQRVFAAGLAVQALGGMSTDPVLGQRLADEVGALDDVIAEIRTAIFALSMDPHPDRPGVRRRILDLLDELGPLFPHPPRMVFSGAVDLLVTAPLADDLVAVIREGLTNVVRHARTRDTEVSVSARADTLTIEISDDGVGLSGSKRCSGIANLSARAERWQGMVSLTDRAPRGTLLRWTAHLDDAPGRAAR